MVVLQGLLGVLFLGSGGSKLLGNSMHVESFSRWRLPQWFRLVVGCLEVVGAVAIIAGLWASGWTTFAWLLACVMFGAACIHLRSRDSFSQTAVPIILCALLVIIAQQ